MPPVEEAPPLPLVLAAVLAAVVPVPLPPQLVKLPKLNSNAPRSNFNWCDLNTDFSNRTVKGQQD
jgi:hypothetical protein